MPCLALTAFIALRQICKASTVSATGYGFDPPNQKYIKLTAVNWTH